MAKEVDPWESDTTDYDLQKYTRTKSRSLQKLKAIIQALFKILSFLYAKIAIKRDPKKTKKD